MSFSPKHVGWWLMWLGIALVTCVLLLIAIPEDLSDWTLGRQRNSVMALVFSGWALCIVGAGVHAQAKGYTFFFGVAGITIWLAPILLGCMPDRSHEPPQRGFQILPPLPRWWRVPIIRRGTTPPRPKLPPRPPRAPENLPTLYSGENDGMHGPSHHG